MTQNPKIDAASQYWNCGTTKMPSTTPKPCVTIAATASKTTADSDQAKRGTIICRAGDSTAKATTAIESNNVGHRGRSPKARRQTSQLDEMRDRHPLGVGASLPSAVTTNPEPIRSFRRLCVNMPRSPPCM